MIKLPLIAMSLGLVTAPTIAAADDNWYVGIGGGSTRLVSSDLESGYAQDNTGTPRILTSSYLDESGGSWKVFGGWRPMRYMAIELNYADYGSQKLGYAGGPINVGPVAFYEIDARDAKRRVTAWGADVIGFWPITESVELFGGIGIAQAQVKLDANFTKRTLFADKEGSSSDTHRSTAPRFRLGGSFTPWSEWAFRLEYEYLDEVGNAFDRVGSGHVGRSAQETIWASVVRSF